MARKIRCWCVLHGGQLNEEGDSLVGDVLRKRFERDGSNEAKVRIHAEFMSISDLIIDKSMIHIY